MKININYISTRFYDKSNITQWMWYYSKSKYIKCFTLRILGIHMRLTENNSFVKLLKIAKNSVIIK